MKSYYICVDNPIAKAGYLEKYYIDNNQNIRLLCSYQQGKYSFLNDDFEDGVSFLEYYKDINRFIDDIMYNLTILNEGMYFVFNDLKCINDKLYPSIGYFKDEYKYPCVLENDREWMLITPNEIETMKKPISEATGNVLTYGLGLGYYAYMVSMKENGVEAAFLIRSAVDSRKQQVLEEVEAVTKAFGGSGSLSSEYQAWQYKPQSELRPVMVEAYKEVYGKEPEICIIHGGLECGIFLGKRPDLDCVSCGPDVLDIHSYNERLDIASTQRSWEFLKLVLKNCK